jgi:hypothetical protein
LNPPIRTISVFDELVKSPDNNQEQKYHRIQVSNKNFEEIVQKKIISILNNYTEFVWLIALSLNGLIEGTALEVKLETQDDLF